MPSATLPVSPASAAEPGRNAPDSDAQTAVAQTAVAEAEVPLIAEASLQYGLGEGVHLIPGLIVVRQQGRTSTALAARMQWFF